jgi:hypothetical protein
MQTINVNVTPDDEAFPKASTPNSDTAHSNILGLHTARAVSISIQHYNLHFRFTISRFSSSQEPYFTTNRDSEMSDYPYKKTLLYKIRKRLTNKRRRRQNIKREFQNATWPAKQVSSCFQYSDHAT